ncbi:MAG: type II toxin-antitoxin system HicA family toxin [Xanthobacteraceae bacterium]|nr:MAG: type II toxin-antitoxin system HicA family toxin [Xanthobacteraceae bacterium]
MPERRVTVDMGAREIPTGTLRSIYRQAGWEW